MGKLIIKTNGHTRDLLNWWNLTPDEKEDVAGYDGVEDSEFFRFKGNVYDLNEFMRLEHSNPDLFKGWDGYAGDSYFSGVLVRYPRDEWGDLDTESIIVGWYYC